MAGSFETVSWGRAGEFQMAWSETAALSPCAVGSEIGGRDVAHGTLEGPEDEVYTSSDDFHLSMSTMEKQLGCVGVGWMDDVGCLVVGQFSQEKNLRNSIPL